jgi:chromosome segregation protein
LHLEPGITCVVGPNGSGKSNVVDALAWVMGEQGARTLRGGKMEDVIFAGTAGRPALGRAEVVLTIDNGDGLLPIEYTEVTISRTMFRNGGSEYAINGQSCRLLDVQELLSDSGIGREMHVIVGQGQLDNVLAASPEQRRGFIEEAAGVLKHRKRKEKALRKLEAMQANLTRVQDLTAELRRQLGPLGRQAELARQAAIIQADVRDCRLRLLADDLAQARANLEQEMADETALKIRHADLTETLEGARASEIRLETEVRQITAQFAQAQQAWYELSGLRERVHGTALLASERRRHLMTSVDDPPAGREPDDLEREAVSIREQEAQLAEQITAARGALDTALDNRGVAEQAADAEEKRLQAEARAAADRRAGVARLSGQLEGLRRRAAAAEAEIARLSEAREGALRRAEQAEREFTVLESTIAGLSVGEEGLDAEHERAAAALAQADQALTTLKDNQHAAERERAALAARHEVLEMGLMRKDGSEAVLAAGDRLSGVLGSIAALVTVEPGWETAVATALGPVSDAVAVRSVDEAVAGLRLLREDDLGRAGFLVGGDLDDLGQWRPLPAGLRYVADLVTTPAQLRPALAGLLRDMVAVDDLAAARALVAEMPELIAVTRDGDLLGRDRAYGGSATAPSLLEVQAAVDEAADRLSEATVRTEGLRRALTVAEQRRTEAAAVEAAAVAKLHESDAQLSAVAEQLGRLSGTARAAVEEAERLAESIVAAEQARDRDLAGLAELEERLVAAEESGDEDVEPSTQERDRLVEAARMARQAETEARLVLRTGEERARALLGRAETLERAAGKQREAQQRAVALAKRRARDAGVAAAISHGAAIILEQVERSLELAAAGRTQAQQLRAEREASLTAAREQVRRLATELDEITSSVHRDELARAEQRMRVEALETKAREEMGIDPDIVIDEYGPHLPIPVRADQDGEPQAPVPFVREQQLDRLKAAERSLAKLGKVNPLALEEFAALEERHAFLTEQLDDLKNTRRDLLNIVKEVDDRVQQVFTQAFEDTAREFADVFVRLFPGGEGRLMLTEPDDMLTTGIEVEARPPGKKVKRLSLLSGGERSLVAVAFLIALFKARPSPFYILDEVEAALDDTNLGRLLDIYEELRERSQLIIITHQKRTMEIADALYGASMRGDGVTAMISQRVREPETA